MRLKNIFLLLTTWWNGKTLSLMLFTRRHGTLIGADQFGNQYYQHASSKDILHKRWVVYNGYADASRIPPSWKAWLYDEACDPPDNSPDTRKPWIMPYEENLTGTPEAYKPKGSQFSRVSKQGSASKHYTPWTGNDTPSQKEKP